MSNNIPDSLKYTKDHEWVAIDGETISLGITDFAQSSLGDIVFVELPEVGHSFEKGDAFGVVESIKSVSDLYTPLSGEILEVNESLPDTPEFCNTAPYSDAWMIKLKLTKKEELNELLSSSDYEKFCNSES